MSHEERDSFLVQCPFICFMIFFISFKIHFTITLKKVAGTFLIENVC